MIKISVDDSLKEIVANGGDPLRTLCQKEVDLFDAYLRKYGDDRRNEYKGGMAKFERWMLEGYLYQKLRGRLDQDVLPDELPG